jgi:hypothetical protein
MKKLLLGSALAASVLLAGSSFAETKVSGYLETTINTKESSTASVTGDSTPATIGHEANIDLKTSKELDNGLTMSAGFGIENGTQADQYLKLTSGGTTFAIGSDVTGGVDNVGYEDFTGSIAQDTHTNGGAKGSLAGPESVHGGNALYLIHKMDLATIEAVYAPSTTTNATGGSSTAGTAGSGYDLAVHGGFGVEGLKVGYGVSEKQSDNSSLGDTESESGGIKYAMSGITAGVGRTTNNTAAGVDTQTTEYGISYQISDQLSIGITDSTVEVDAIAIDEELNSFQVGYDFGGMGVTLGYYQAENVGGVSGTDQESFEIRTVTKF